MPALVGQSPWEGVAETSGTPVGSVSVRLTSVAVAGPAFETTTTYVSSEPNAAGSELSD